MVYLDEILIDVLVCGNKSMLGSVDIGIDCEALALRQLLFTPAQRMSGVSFWENIQVRLDGRTGVVPLSDEIHQKGSIGRVTSPILVQVESRKT